MKSFINAFKNPTFKGRVSRSEFWKCMGMMVLIYFVVYYVTVFLAALFNAFIFIDVVLLAYPLIIFPASLTMQVKRLHDIGESGGWLWLSLLPIGNIVVIVMLCKKGDAEANIYGEPPIKNTSSDTSVCDKAVSLPAEACGIKKEVSSIEKTVDTNADAAMTDVADEENSLEDSQSKNGIAVCEAAESKTVENELQENKKEETGNIPKKAKPSKRMVFLSVALAVLLVISVGVNIYQIKENLRLIERLNIKGNTINALRKDIFSMEDELDFYKFYAVIVTESDNYYHEYDCPYIADCDSFWIFDVFSAKDLGYERCPYCR